MTSRFAQIAEKMDWSGAGAVYAPIGPVPIQYQVTRPQFGQPMRVLAEAFGTNPVTVNNTIARERPFRACRLVGFSFPASMYTIDSNNNTFDLSQANGAKTLTLVNGAPSLSQLAAQITAAFAGDVTAGTMSGAAVLGTFTATYDAKTNKILIKNTSGFTPTGPAITADMIGATTPPNFTTMIGYSSGQLGAAVGASVYLVPTNTTTLGSTFYSLKVDGIRDASFSTGATTDELYRIVSPGPWLVKTLEFRQTDFTVLVNSGQYITLGSFVVKWTDQWGRDVNFNGQRWYAILEFD